MLQDVYMGKGFRQASSLYCRWISVERPEGAEPVAVGMDSEMRAFKNESFAPEPAVESGEEIAQGSADLTSA